MPNIDIEPKGRFSSDLKRAVEESGLTLTELAQKVDSTYEHMRKLVAGRAYPSTHLLRAMASTLGADREEWSEMIEADKLFKRYKKLPKVLNTNPKLEPFEAIINALNQEQIEAMLSMGKTFVRQNGNNKGKTSSHKNAQKD